MQLSRLLTTFNGSARIFESPWIVKVHWDHLCVQSNVTVRKSGQRGVRNGQLGKNRLCPVAIRAKVLLTVCSKVTQTRTYPNSAAPPIPPRSGVTLEIYLMYTQSILHPKKPSHKCNGYDNFHLASTPARGRCGDLYPERYQARHGRTRM
jgi:hypothetical protein